MSHISIFGLGYVGCVSAACFAREGHTVIGVDVSDAKVDMINRGLSTIVEEGIAELVHEMYELKRLNATTDINKAVLETDVSLICVGTPSRSNGSIDLRYIERVSEQIGTALRGKRTHHTVVIRSTVMPGTIDDVVIPTLERFSGKKNGEGFAVCSNPEFLREGTSIKDFYDPPFTIIGSHNPAHAAPVLELYAGVSAPSHIVGVRVAEMLKYACNSFHGLKVSFANEIGNLCKTLGVDSHEVMQLFCEDKKLNISSAYLKPGFAFGGSCLPKDLRALVHRGRVEDVPMTVLEAVLESNLRQVERAFRMIQATGCRRVGILGMAFKAGTDDLRESPMVALIEMLIGKGYKLTIYDRDVIQANLVGSNREYIEKEIPHVWTLMRNNMDEVISQSEVIVVGNNSSQAENLDTMLEERIIIDLVRAFSLKGVGSNYQGICW